MMRWKIAECPLIVSLKKVNEQKHSVAKCYNDLTFEQKKKCKEIKSFVNKILPDARVFLFGSQINGRYTEESDYDVLILWLAYPIEKERIKQHDYGFKVDVRFGHSNNVSKMVEI